MLTLLFIVLMFGVFGKIAWWGFKAAWGITKFLLWIVCLPIVLIIMMLSGLIFLALPILVVFGIIAIIVPLIS